MVKKFPTTIQEAFELSADDAEECLDLLEDALDGVLPKDPPEGFDTKESAWSLAYVVDMLNRLSTHPDNPFGTEGWIAVLPNEDETELE